MNEEDLKKLFQKYLDNNCTSAEKKYLDELFNSYLEDTKFIGDDELEGTETLESEIFEKVRQRIHSAKNHQDNKTMKLRKNKAVLWTAASIVILFGIGAFWFTSQETSSVNKTISHTVDLVIRQTSAGEKKEVHLKDGSIVYLNSGSKLSYSKNFGQDGTRWVKLDGEAFFEVKKDESKPFIIESGNIVTEVKGTSFNIKAFPEASDVAVTVLTGLVGVSKKGEKNKVELIPNRQALFSKEDGLLNIMEVDAQRFSHWKDGILHFEEAQLEDVLIALERWYGVNINTDNLTLENCTLTATFDKSSIYEVMEGIKFAKEGVEYTLENNTIEMKGFCNQ